MSGSRDRAIPHNSRRSLCPMPRPSTVVDRLHGSFNARDWDGYRELLDEHVEYEADGGPIHGRAPLIDYLKAAACERPGLRYGPARVIAETEETLVSEVRIIDETDARGGADTSEYSCCAIHRLAGGRIVEWRSYTATANLETARAPFVSVVAEQLALRRVAELVARHAPAEEVFAVVTQELRRLLGTDLMVGTVRFEPDGTGTILAQQGVPTDLLSAGSGTPLPRGSVTEQMRRTGRAARVDDYEQLNDPTAAFVRQQGVRSAAGGPIVVNGLLWGGMVVASKNADALPRGTEERVAEFAELVATAISNVESRARVERLAAEQSALRRVAEYVAAQPPPEQVFALVTQELSRLLPVDMVRTVRFEPDGSATVVAALGMADDPIPPGTNAPIPSGSVIDKVSRTRRPARVDDYAKLGGPIGARLGEQGAGSAAGVGSVSRPAPVPTAPMSSTTARNIFSLLKNMARKTPSVRATTLAERTPADISGSEA